MSTAMKKNNDNNKKVNEMKEINFIPWHSYIGLAIPFFFFGICVDRALNHTDILALIVGTAFVLQMTIVVYLSLRDLNKTYNKLFRKNSEDKDE